MKYLPPLLGIAALLLLALPTSPATADEPAGSLLERLDAEAAALVARADAAEVRIRRGGHRYRGVLVGTPPRLVAPYVGDTTGPSIFVALPDGREYGSSIVDGDAELGVSVLKIPDAWAAKLRGVDLASPTRARRGGLGVLGGERPTLALIRRVDPERGRLLSDVRTDVAGLLGAGGRLLGLRASGSQACTACHTANLQTVDVQWRGLGTWLYRPTYERSVALLSALDANGKPYYYVQDGKGNRLKVVGGRIVSAESGQPLAAPTTRYVGTADAHANDYVSAAVLRRVLRDIESHGVIRRGYVGVVPGVHDAKQKGVRITSVLKTSPAAAAGIQAGDVVTALDDVPCSSTARFNVLLAQKRPGDTVRVALADREPVVVTLADRSDEMQNLLTAEQLGLRVRALDDSLREWLGVPEGTEGVLVVQATGAIAKNAGLRRGDVLVAVDDAPVRDLAELDAALAVATDAASLKVLRGTKETLLLLAPLPKPNRRAAPR